MLAGIDSGAAAGAERVELLRESSKKPDEAVCGFYFVGSDGGLRRKVQPLRRTQEEAEAAAEEKEAAARKAAAAVTPAPAAAPAAAVPQPLTGLDMSFANALVVMPPKELWGPIQALREKHDPAYERWMPHINVVWPFATEKHGACAAAAAAYLADVKPFEVHFNGFDTFERGNKGGVLFLDPTDAEGGSLPQLGQAREAVLTALPELRPDDDGDDSDFHPHLTVGKLSKPQLAKVRDAAAWQPVSFLCTELHIISRPDKETPFAVSQVVPLGGCAGLS